MNRSVFLRISIAVLLLFAVTQLVVSQAFVSSFRKGFAQDFETSYSDQLLLLSNLVRNDLLMNNLREARNKIARATLSSVIYQIWLQENGRKEILFEKAQPAPSNTIEKSVPIYFSDAESKWGDLIFSIDSSSMETRIKSLRKQTFIAQVALLAFLVVTVCFLLGFLWDSGTRLESTFGSIIKGESNATRAGPKLWSPLIEHASLLANQSRAIDLLVDDFKVRNEKRKEVTRLIHDLKSPISAIKIASAKIRSDDEEPVNLLRVAVSRIDAMIDSTIQSSKLDSVQMNLHAQNLGEVLREIKSSSANIYEGIQLEFSGLELNTYSLTSPTDFARVIQNLINNSIEAGAKNIRLVLKTSGNFNYLVVADDGAGMPEELLPLVGKVPVSAGKLSEQQSGSGIGLFGAFQMIKRWNGDIRVASSKGKGTQVLIALPCA